MAKVRAVMSPTFAKYLSAHPQRDWICKQIGYEGPPLPDVPETDRERVMQEAVQEAGHVGRMYPTVIKRILSGSFNPRV